MGILPGAIMINIEQKCIDVNIKMDRNDVEYETPCLIIVDVMNTFRKIGLYKSISK